MVKGIGKLLRFGIYYGRPQADGEEKKGSLSEKEA